MTSVPWQPAYQPPKSEGSWRTVVSVLAAAVAIAVLGAVFLTASRVTSGHGIALADTSLDITVHELPNGDVEVTYPAGHFRALYPSEPTPETDADSFAGIHVSLHGALATEPSRALVASIDLSRPMPSGVRDQFYRGAVRGFINVGQLTVVSEGATTFQGLDAYKAVVRVNGETIDFLIFLANASRAYMIVANDGAAFDKLAASFVALP